jgi:ParB-like chromosome segregation protein Spo0J
LNINLDKIRIDCGTQSRHEMNQERIKSYMEDILSGCIFPPVILYFDGINYYLADGFHRYFATKAAGSPGILCEVTNGTLRDAILYSLKANNEHGLHKTNADKRKCVLIMLNDLEWEGWSDREIAKQCGVSHSFVSVLRKELGTKPAEIKFKRDGEVIKMKQKLEPVAKEESHLATFTDESEIDDQKENLFAAVDMLKAENEALTDKLALASMSADDVDKEMAESLIKDLRAQIRLLEIELKAVQISRDSFQRENVELMRQVQSYQRKIKKEAK